MGWNKRRGISRAGAAGAPALAGLVLSAAALFAPVGAHGQSPALGLTVSTNTFSPFARPADPVVPPGLYWRAGVAWLPGRHFEVELYHVAQMTPRFYSEVLFGASAGYWILQRKRTSYLNMVADAGLLYGLDGTLLLNLKLCPAVFGSPAYGSAERFFTLGLLYDVEGRRAFFQLQLLALTLYL